MRNKGENRCCCFPRREGPNPDDPATIRSKRIDDQLEVDKKERKRKRKNEIKLLLLGAGESGKSTFLKQMKIIHDVHFDEAQIDEFRKIIYQNLIRGMRVLVDANRKLGIPLQNESQNRIYGEQLLLFNDSSHIDKHNFNDLKPMLRSLWNDAGIQEAFERRNEYQLTDSVGYFFQHLDRIAVTDYTPSHQDILRARKATKGIHEFELTIKNKPFVFIDVGGQRTERAKWFHCFDNEGKLYFPLHCPVIYIRPALYVQWSPLNMPTSGQATMAIITGWLYYPEFLFSKKSKFLSKSGHINRMDILSVDKLSGVYCTRSVNVNYVSINYCKCNVRFI